MTQDDLESAKDLYGKAIIFYDHKAKNDLLETCHLLLSKYPNSKEAKWAVNNFKISTADINSWAMQIQNIRSKLESKTTDELLEIWEARNKAEYTEEAFVAIKHLLMAPGALLPVKSEAAIANKTTTQVMSPEEISKAIKTANFILLIWGAFNIVYWYFGDAEGRQFILNRFTEIKPWLWIGMYGGLVNAIGQIICGAIGLLIRRPVIVLIAGFSFLLVGLWNLGIDVLAILALKEYGYNVTTDFVFKNINWFWKVIGVMQLGWGLKQIGIYSNIVEEGSKALRPELTSNSH